MLAEKVTQFDLVLLEILKNPVLYAEFVNNIDRTDREEEFKLTWYQKDVACDYNPYISLCMARAVGKTEILSNIISQTLILNIYPDDYIIYTVPNEAQLKPVFANVSRKFRANSFLKNFIEPKSGIKTNESIKLLNNALLLCRIAGTSGTGVNVIGLHTPFEIVDEAAYFPFGTYKELIPTLNTWTPGFKRYSSGVPSGLRENNVLWLSDQGDNSYTKHRATIFDNPRITPDDIEKFKIDYGGVDSEDWMHLALGQHGKPVYSVFDRTLMRIEGEPVYKLVLDGISERDNIGNYIDKLIMFPSLPTNNMTIFGIDLGYTDPTAIFILYVNKNGQIKFHGKVQLNKVTYPIQMKIIDALDTKFKPSLIGIDVGAAGRGEVQHLIQDDEFKTKHYEKRIYPVEFSSSVQLGFDSSGEELKSKTKPFAVSLLQEYANTHKLIFSSTDYDTILELERMTYTKNPQSGDLVYRTLTPKGGQKGEDHFTSALLCATLAYYMESESMIRPKSVKLASPSWLL
jgi:hypothetical protein